MAGGTDDAPPLARSDAPDCAAEALGAALADLDEDQCVAFRTDEVDLAEAATVVANNDAQAGGFEVASGELLGGLAEGVQDASGAIAAPSGVASWPRGAGTATSGQQRSPAYSRRNADPPP